MIKYGWQNRIFMSPTFWQIPIKCFKLEQFQKLILNQSGNVVSKCCEDFEISKILTFSLISLQSSAHERAKILHWRTATTAVTPRHCTTLRPGHIDTMRPWHHELLLEMGPRQRPPFLVSYIRLLLVVCISELKPWQTDSQAAKAWTPCSPWSISIQFFTPKMRRIKQFLSLSSIAPFTF